MQKITRDDVGNTSSSYPTLLSSTSYATSRSVERILNLVRQIFPKQLTVNIQDDSQKQQQADEFYSWKVLNNYSSTNSSSRSAVFLLLVGNLGDTSDCSDLAICNAIKDYSSNFDPISRCIINVHNDLFHFLYFVQKLCENSNSNSIHNNSTTTNSNRKMNNNNNIRTVLNYNMICNYDFQKTCNLLNHFAREYKKSSRKAVDDGLNPLNIIFWSGHGDQYGGLSFQNHKYLSFRDFLSCFKNGGINSNNRGSTAMVPPPTVGDYLFIFECCYSNTREIMEFINSEMENSTTTTLPPPHYDKMFICSSIEKSGGWICDGVDSNGILTNFIIDPVSSYFKVKFKIFFDLGQNAFDYFPYGNAPIKQQFYSIMDRYLSRIFKLVLPSSFIEYITSTNRLSQLNASIVILTFKHFILLNCCLDELFQKQTPFSYPSICIQQDAIDLFNEMSNHVDELLMELFRKNHSSRK